jgi:hypothetical protein
MVTLPACWRTRGVVWSHPQVKGKSLREGLPPQVVCIQHSSFKALGNGGLQHTFRGSLLDHYKGLLINKDNDDYVPTDDFLKLSWQPFQMRSDLGQLESPSIRQAYTFPCAFKHTSRSWVHFQQLILNGITRYSKPPSNIGLAKRARTEFHLTKHRRYHQLEDYPQLLRHWPGGPRNSFSANS